MNKVLLTLSRELKAFNMVLSSSPESITKVEALVEEIRNEISLSDDVYANAMIALTEAVNNAIYHGNKADPQKNVKIDVRQEKNQLCFTISDDGKGFDYNNLADPTAPENIEKPTGRGVFLMKQLSDLVIFSSNGKTVEIFFKI